MPSVIDAHPERERIEFDLALGVSLRQISTKYGVSKSAAHRHQKKIPQHLRAANLAAMLAPGMDEQSLRVEEGRGLLALLAAVRARDLLIQERALANGDDKLALKAGAQIIQVAEVLGRYLGEFVSVSKSTQVSVILSPAYAKLRNCITDVLRKHPAALGEFTERMRALEAEELGQAMPTALIEHRVEEAVAA